MTAEQKKRLALFLDLSGDYLRDGYKQAREEYRFIDDEEMPPRGTEVQETGTLPMETGHAGGSARPAERGIDSLEAVEEEIRGCTRCPLHKTRTLAVPGEGVKRPLALVIGEGPGAEEDASGRPFVGKAGQLLDRMLSSVNLSRERNCFIINVVKCRPPNNRDPLPEEIVPCGSFLSRQLRILKPLVLLSAGRVSTQTLLNTSEGIGRLRGRFAEYSGLPLLPTYHPSALLRDASLKRPVWEDLKLLRGKLTELDKHYALEIAEGT
ncbi:MAG: uracil-DNA glycosylase [Treponema sp.]|jgi:DNA polymerase|nr:uracil-DNA glycosylase [Treponema sp.]